MDESGFRHWLVRQKCSPKLISDSVCRIRKLRKDFNLDFDAAYKLDKGVALLSLFDRKGATLGSINPQSTVPIGNYSLATYKLAVKKYFSFLQAQE